MGIKRFGNIEDISENFAYELSAALGADNFFYGIFDYGQKLLFADSFSFSNSSYESDFSEGLSFLANKINIRKCNIAVANHYQTEVPLDEYVADKQGALYRNLFAKPEGHKIYTNRGDQSVSIFQMEDKLLNAISSLVEINTLKHYSNAQYEGTHLKDSDQVLVTILDQKLYVTTIKANQRQLTNVYSCDKLQDFLYYIGLAYQQSGLSLDQVPLYICGDITKDSDLYQLLYTYIRHIHFAFLSGDQTDVGHIYHPLQLISKCG